MARGSILSRARLITACGHTRVPTRCASHGGLLLPSRPPPKSSARGDDFRWHRSAFHSFARSRGKRKKVRSITEINATVVAAQSLIPKEQQTYRASILGKLARRLHAPLARPLPPSSILRYAFHHIDCFSRD